MEKYNNCHVLVLLLHLDFCNRHMQNIQFEQQNHLFSIVYVQEGASIKDMADDIRSLRAGITSLVEPSRRNQSQVWKVGRRQQHLKLYSSNLQRLRIAMTEKLSNSHPNIRFWRPFAMDAP